MDHTHALVGLVSAVGVLGIAGAIGFAQPEDDLEPPPGPVVDTQPSLTTIQQAISSLQSDGCCDPQFEFVHSPVVVSPGSSFSVNVQQVRLDRIRMVQGGFLVEDAGGRSLRVFAGISPTSGLRAETRDFDFGVVLEGPITFTGLPNQTGSEATVFYRELP